MDDDFYNCRICDVPVLLGVLLCRRFREEFSCFFYVNFDK